MTVGARQPRITGQQWRVKCLRQRLAAEVGQRLLGTMYREVPAECEAPQGLGHLKIGELRRVQVLVG